MNLLSHLKLKTLSKLLSSNGEISPVSVLIVEDDGAQRQQFSLALHGMTDLEIEVAQLGDGINMVNSLVNEFLANQVITQGDWQGIMDRIRRL